MKEARLFMRILCAARQFFFSFYINLYFIDLNYVHRDADKTVVSEELRNCILLICEWEYDDVDDNDRLDNEEKENSDLSDKSGKNAHNNDGNFNKNNNCMTVQYSKDFRNRNNNYIGIFNVQKIIPTNIIDYNYESDEEEEKEKREKMERATIEMEISYQFSRSVGTGFLF